LETTTHGGKLMSNDVPCLRQSGLKIHDCINIQKSFSEDSTPTVHESKHTTDVESGFDNNIFNKTSGSINRSGDVFINWKSISNDKGDDTNSDNHNHHGDTATKRKYDKETLNGSNLGKYLPSFVLLFMPIVRPSLYDLRIIENKFCNTHRGIHEDHGININQHSKPRNKCEYSIQYFHLFCGF
jgi:hypothetical protein